MELEYRVVPAPRRLKKRKGVAAPDELLAATLADAINAEAREGWEFVRAETLTAEEPGGLFRKARVVEETLLIFRRPRRRAHEAPAFAPAGPTTAARGEAARSAAADPNPSPPATAPPMSDAGPAPRLAPAAEPRPAGAGTRPGAADPAEVSRRPARPSEGVPALLRPVPRFRPGEKS